GSGLSTASPNIWRSGADEVIIVPQVYPTYGGHEVRLVTFTTTGDQRFNQEVTNVRDETTSEVDGTIFVPSVNRWFGLDPTELLPTLNQLPRDAALGMPRVGMFESGRGDPIVVVADNYQNLVGYAFTLADGFRELFREHLTGDVIRMSSPVMFGDHS